MRRIWVVCVALVLLAGWGAGCGGGPLGGGPLVSGQGGGNDQAELKIKEAFVRQLVGFCAEVDRQLAKIDPKAQPGIAAEQLAGFVGQARSRPAPDLDRDQLEVLLTEMDGTAGHFRSAQVALAAGDQPAYQQALAQASRQLVSADAAAQEYGMPPLDSCPQHDPATPPGPGPSAATPATVTGWQLRHESVEAVQQVSAAVLDGRIWIAGGLTTPTEATTSSKFYDPAIDAWESGPPLPEPVHHAMLVTYRNQLVLIGGFVPRGDDLLATTSSRVLFLDTAAGRWVDGPPLKQPRAAGAAAVVGDKIVVVGGRVGHPEQLVTGTEVYDGTSWHDGTDIPVPGDHLAAAADPAYLYAVGGREFTAGSNTDAVQRYEPATDQWTTMTALPQPVSGAGAAIIDGQLLVAGGESTTNVFSTVVAYDLTTPTATWTTTPALTQGRHGLAVTAIGNTLYAIAGSTRAGHTASTTTVETLNLPPRRARPVAGWQLRHESVEAVQQVSAAVLDGRIWIAGGLTTPTEATTSSKFYDPAIDAWESGPPLPEPVHHAMLVTYRNQLVLIGGFVPRGDDLLATTSSRVLFLDTAAGRWVDGPPLKQPRAAGAAAVVGDKIVVVGGRVGHPEQLVTGTEVYDGTSWHDGTDIPVPGDHLAAAADPAYLYAVGGREFTAGSNTDAVQRYEPATDQWTTMTALPQPVSGAGAAIIDGQLLVAGGESTTNVFSTVVAYDLTTPTATWTTTPALTQGRHGLAVTAIGNTLYAIAGSTRAGHTASTTTVETLTFS